MNQTEHVAAVVVDEPVDGVSGFFREDSAAVQEIFGCSTIYGFLRADTVGVVEVCVRAAVLGQGIQSAARPSQYFSAITQRVADLVVGNGFAVVGGEEVFLILFFKQNQYGNTIILGNHADFAAYFCINPTNCCSSNTLNPA